MLGSSILQAAHELVGRRRANAQNELADLKIKAEASQRSNSALKGDITPAAVMSKASCTCLMTPVLSMSDILDHEMRWLSSAKSPKEELDSFVAGLRSQDPEGLGLAHSSHPTAGTGAIQAHIPLQAALPIAGHLSEVGGGPFGRGRADCLRQKYGSFLPVVAGRLDNVVYHDHISRALPLNLATFSHPLSQRAGVCTCCFSMCSGIRPFLS